MARRRKRRIKKKIKVIFLIIILIILLGSLGSYMLLFRNRDFNDNKGISDNNSSNGAVKETKKVDSEVKLKDAPINSVECKNYGDGEYKTTTGYTIKIENGIAMVDGNIIVNKTYSLPETYRPTNPFFNSDKDWAIDMIDKDVMNAFKSMQSDAIGIGLNIYIASGFRGYKTQERLYNNYVSQDGKEAADTYSARPGYSEHQSGLCFDLNSVNDSFANTNEGKWVNDNAHLYGFVIRFPKGKEDKTGYQYESWHLRYVGRELASKLYNDGDWISLEEYYGLSSSY